jgi:hypothetical protein
MFDLDHRTSLAALRAALLAGFLGLGLVACDQGNGDDAASEAESTAEEAAEDAAEAAGDAAEAAGDAAEEAGDAAEDATQ